MKVALSTIGKFHTFDLARSLNSHGLLAGICSGYPSFKLKNERLPAELIHTFPWLHAPYMGMKRKEWLGNRILRDWEYYDRVTLDRYAAATLPSCDLFVGLSGSALITGRRAQQSGAHYLCDRGSTHIRTQDQLLREEHARWNQPYSGIDPRIIEREEAEYSTADAISVPSQFNKISFLQAGIPAEKINVLPYGVDLTLFQPTSVPSPHCFDVLFVGAMSLRKGVPDLLAAFKRLQHPRKTLTFAGSWSSEFIAAMRKLELWNDDIVVLGHVPQRDLKNLMSRAHVMLLPSIEEGLALVQAQAMACGCPVIATHNTGADDLYEDGCHGYIVPIRRPDLLTDRMQALADQTQLRDQMANQALNRVRQAGGWEQYGAAAISLYRRLTSNVTSTKQQ